MKWRSRTVTCTSNSGLVSGIAPFSRRGCYPAGRPVVGTLGCYSASYGIQPYHFNLLRKDALRSHAEQLVGLQTLAPIGDPLQHHFSPRSQSIVQHFASCPEAAKIPNPRTNLTVESTFWKSIFSAKLTAFSHCSGRHNRSTILARVEIAFFDCTDSIQ